MKIVFTCGKFDCLNSGHFHLIKEMRKVALPKGKIVVVLYDDYSCFLRDKKFPLQSREHRKNNLEFIVDDIRICYSDSPATVIAGLQLEAKNDNGRLIYAGCDKTKPEIAEIKKIKIPLRIINKPKI